MAVSTKDQVWFDVKYQMSRTIDRLGKRIDAGIMDCVAALNVNDIRTSASCEGHLDWGCPYPWIDVESDDPRIADLEQFVTILLSEGKRESEELAQLHLELKQIHYQEELKLTSALESFYQTHPLDYDRHLTLIHIKRGGCRMRPQGADIQEIRSLDERTLKLKEYQQEMNAFAAFLKERFFDGRQDNQ